MKKRGIVSCITLFILFWVSTIVICAKVADCEVVPINHSARIAIKRFLCRVFVAKKPYVTFEKYFPKCYKRIKYMCKNTSQVFVKKMFYEVVLCKSLRRMCKEKLFPTKITHGIKKLDLRSNLNWCEDCYNARKETRTYLMLLLMNKLAAKKDKSEQLHYVSFGSGTLLQDYLLIKSLIWLGFNNIQVHVIDLLYDAARGVQEFGGAYVQLNEWRAGAAKALDSFKKLLCDPQMPIGGQKIDASKTPQLKIHSYTTHNEFLEKWDTQDKADLLFLIDPIGKGFRTKCVFCKDGELLSANMMFANHIGIDYTQKDFKDDIGVKVVALLPHFGQPALFYKGNMGKKTKQFLLGLQRAGGVTRIGFIPKFKDFLKASGKNSSNVSVQQSQRYSFYEIVKYVGTKKTLLYQLDGNKIFSGGCNIRAREYLRRGVQEVRVMCVFVTKNPPEIGGFKFNLS